MMKRKIFLATLCCATALTLCGFDTKKDDTTKISIETEVNEETPDDLELMSYAQTVLKDFYPDCKYSRKTKDYTIAGSDLRYKIEGEFSTDKTDTEATLENFCMIIEFTDKKYETYDLVLLEADKETVYESETADDANAYTTFSGNIVDNDILNEENTEIYNEVMNKLDLEYTRDENEILEEMAPKYDMTAEELKQFIFDYMDAYYK